MRIVSPGGEVIRAFTAEDLLAAAGITDVTAAEDVELASSMDGADHLLSIAREAKERVGEEFVRRMDRDGSWTRHVDDWVLKSSSPDAGSVSYDNAALAAALDELVAAEVISAKAREAAIEWYYPPAPAPSWKRKPAGINRLLKLGGKVAEAVESAQVPVEPPARTAKLSRRQA